MSATIMPVLPERGFCQQCYLEAFHQSGSDLIGLTSRDVVCIGCGPTTVDRYGYCVSDCFLHHSEPVLTKVKRNLTVTDELMLVQSVLLAILVLISLVKR
jgi:hypothetical protein